MRISDWSSDVCSSDLELLARLAYPVQGTPRSRQKSQARGAGSLPHRRDHGLNLRLDLFGAGLHKHLAIDAEGWGAADNDCSRVGDVLLHPAHRISGRPRARLRDVEAGLPGGSTGAVHLAVMPVG